MQRLLNIFQLPELECSGDSYARNYYTPFEEYDKKLSDFVEKYNSNLSKQSVEYTSYNAFNKDRIGYSVEAQKLYSKYNNLMYFLFLLETMYMDNEIKKLYQECKDTSCNDSITRDCILDSYGIDKLLNKLKCSYPYKEMRNLLKILGWNLEDVPQEERVGINYMCIIDETIEDFNCSCNDSVFTVS